MIEELNEQDFAEKVLDSNTGVVVDFHAEWCLPCKPVSEILRNLSQQYNSRVKFYRIDTDKNMHLSQKLKITDIPTVLFLSPGGKIDIQRGTTTEDKLQAKIEALLS